MESSSAVEPVKPYGQPLGRLPADDPQAAQRQSAARQRGAAAQALMELEGRELLGQARLARESPQSSAARRGRAARSRAEWLPEAQALRRLASDVALAFSERTWPLRQQPPDLQAAGNVCAPIRRVRDRVNSSASSFR